MQPYATHKKEPPLFRVGVLDWSDSVLLSVLVSTSFGIIFHKIAFIIFCFFIHTAFQIQ